MFNWSNHKELEDRRTEVLSAIRGEESNIETMAQRPRRAEDILDTALLAEVRQRLAEIKQRAEHATTIDNLDDLVDDAEAQGQLRAYICPIGEIRNEGNLAVDVMEEWSLPKAVIAKLRASLGQELEKADTDPETARSALRELFEEYDSWATYTDDYEDTMQRFANWLFAASVVCPLLALLAFHWRFTTLAGLLLAGAAGSCVSVMAKMPTLDVSLSGELDAYGRRVLTRIATGVSASLIGCALLAWGLLPISIQNQTFADALSACTGSPANSCTGLKTLILLGVPMLFGFSERALTSFETRVLGNSKGARARR